MKKIILLNILILFYHSLNATQYITGTIKADVRNCEDMETVGTTSVMPGRNVKIISNNAVTLKTGFKASYLNNTSLQIYLDQVDCCPCNGSMIDPRDTKLYSTARIGDQVWMTENLDYVTQYSWELNRSGIDFGRQYLFEDYMNFSEVEGAQGVCPSGWHIPTIEELIVLFEPYNSTSEVYQGLKENGSSGFDALIHDYLWEICPTSIGRIYKNFFASTGFGTSSNYPGSDGFYMLDVQYKDLNGNITEVAGWIATNVKCGYSSVRCIKDCSRSTPVGSGDKSAGESSRFSIENRTIVKPESISDVRIYPNPTDGVFMIDLKDPETVTSIQIIDMKGQVIHEFPAVSSTVYYDLSNYAKGVYFISVITGDNCYNEKLIVY